MIYRQWYMLMIGIALGGVMSADASFTPVAKDISVGAEIRKIDVDISESIPEPVFPLRKLTIPKIGQEISEVDQDWDTYNLNLEARIGRNLYNVPDRKRLRTVLGEDEFALVLFYSTAVGGNAGVRNRVQRDFRSMARGNLSPYRDSSMVFVEVDVRIPSLRSYADFLGVTVFPSIVPFRRPVGGQKAVPMRKDNGEVHKLVGYSTRDQMGEFVDELMGDELERTRRKWPPCRLIPPCLKSRCRKYGDCKPKPPKFGGYPSYEVHCPRCDDCGSMRSKDMPDCPCGAREPISMPCPRKPFGCGSPCALKEEPPYPEDYSMISMAALSPEDKMRIPIALREGPPPLGEEFMSDMLSLSPEENLFGPDPFRRNPLALTDVPADDLPEDDPFIAPRIPLARTDVPVDDLPEDDPFIAPRIPLARTDIPVSDLPLESQPRDIQPRTPPLVISNMPKETFPQPTPQPKDTKKRTPLPVADLPKGEIPEPTSLFKPKVEVIPLRVPLVVSDLPKYDRPKPDEPKELPPSDASRSSVASADADDGFFSDFSEFISCFFPCGQEKGKKAKKRKCGCREGSSMRAAQKDLLYAEATKPVPTNYSS